MINAMRATQCALALVVIPSEAQSRTEQFETSRLV